MDTSFSATQPTHLNWGPAPSGPSAPALYPGEVRASRSGPSPAAASFAPSAPSLYSEEAKADARKLLSTAGSIAQSVLGNDTTLPTPPKQSKSSPKDGKAPSAKSYVYNDHRSYTDRSWNIGNSNTTIINSKSEKEKEKDREDFWSIVGMVVAAAFSFVTGKFIGDYRKEKKKLAKFEATEKDWLKNSSNVYSITSGEVNKAVTLTKNILHRRINQLVSNIAFLALATLVAGTVGIAAMMSAEVVLTGALVTGAVLTCAYLFKLGLSCASDEDDENIADAKDIEDIIKKQSRSFEASIKQ